MSASKGHLIIFSALYLRILKSIVRLIFMYCLIAMQIFVKDGEFVLAFVESYCVLSECKRPSEQLLSSRFYLE